MHNNKQYASPTLSIDDIISNFASWGFSISHEQLIRPSPDFAQSIYSICLSRVTEISQETLADISDAVVASLEHPDLYGLSTTRAIFLHHIKRLARIAKIPDFSARDLSFPEPQRTRSHLAALINLIRFIEEYEPIVTGVRDRSAALVKEREKVSKDLADIHVKLSAIKAKRAEDEPKCQALRGENDQGRAKLLALKELQTKLTQESEVIKREKSHVLQRKDAILKETALVSDGVSKTRSRIVQSPERIKRNIATMGSTAHEDKRTLSANEIKTRDLQAKINLLLNVEKDVRSCIESLQVIEKEKQSLEVSNKELAEVKDQLEEKKIEKNELILRRERVLKQLSNAQEKLERAQRHAQEKRQASQQTIERLQREYEQMVVERRENDQQVEDINAQANEVEKKMAQHLKQNETELNQLLSEYWKLRHETAVYMEIMCNKLAETSS